MGYLWVGSENYPNKNIGIYDSERSPDRFLLRKGVELSSNEFNVIPTIHFGILLEKVLKYDCLLTTAAIPLVNRKIKNLLDNVASKDVQFFPAKVVCKNGISEDYFFLNVIHLVKAINHEESRYTKMLQVDAISGFTHLVLKENCLGNYNLAREEEYRSQLLVSEQIKKIFDQEKITGVWLARPNEFYKPLSELI